MILGLITIFGIDYTRRSRRRLKQPDNDRDISQYQLLHEDRQHSQIFRNLPQAESEYTISPLMKLLSVSRHFVNTHRVNITTMNGK
ncbi:hypothetical protein ACO0LB_19360 [Undibacterium sp. SXout7W]